MVIYAIYTNLNTNQCQYLNIILFTHMYGETDHCWKGINVH